MSANRLCLDTIDTADSGFESIRCHSSKRKGCRAVVSKTGCAILDAAWSLKQSLLRQASSKLMEGRLKRILKGDDFTCLMAYQAEVSEDSHAFKSLSVLGHWGKWS